MKHKKLLKTTLVQTKPSIKDVELKNKQFDKKVYVAPKLSYEGKWDTVTMQFGFSTGAP